MKTDWLRIAQEILNGGMQESFCRAFGQTDPRCMDISRIMDELQRRGYEGTAQEMLRQAREDAD
jgi:hypothetical protein